MVFLIHGNFSALLGHNFIEDLKGARVKIYLPESDRAITAETVSNKKYPLLILDEKEVLAKERMLIGKGLTDTSGNYEVQLSDEYKDGPVEINIELLNVPHQKGNIDLAVQFVLTTLQPVWRTSQNGYSYNWSYCFPGLFWRDIRSRFDAWTIFGSVKFANDKKKFLSGVKVSAYDHDWIKDDDLGSAITNELGQFRIDFCSTDFKQTFLSPLINVETPFSPIPGPGVYFKVTSYNGRPIYIEEPKYGKLPERRNIPNCFHIDLFVDKT